MEINFTPAFIRQFHALDENLQEEVYEKIGLFKDRRNHKQLKIHKLKGHLRERYSFSVNYRYRIVFVYISKKEIVLFAVGDHDVYK